MFSKIGVLMEALRVGQQLQSAGAWKNVQILANVLAVIVMTLKAFDVPVPVLSDADYATLAGAFVLIVNVVLTMATSAKVGLPPKS